MKRGRRRRRAWPAMLALAVVTAASPGMVLLAAGLLLPALSVLACDRAPGRPVARTMLCGALAAAAPTLAALMRAGGGAEDAVTLLAAGPPLVQAWAAAGAAWLLTELAPVLTLVVLAAHDRARAARLARERDACQARFAADRS